MIHMKTIFYFFSCQSLDDRINYAELVFNKRHQKSNDLLPPSNPIQPKWTNNQSEEEVPPPLPYRQQTVVNSAALHPSSNENRLYPSLEEEVSPVVMILKLKHYSAVQLTHIQNILDKIHRVLMIRMSTLSSF